MPRSLLAIAVAVPLLLAGCGSDSADSTASAEPTASAAASPAGDATTVDGVTVTGAPDAEPTITIEEGATPPQELVVEEITPGDGKAVGPNSLVTVQYVGTAWSTGQVFDSSWATGELQFPIKGVITGWQEGLQGVKEGSRVLLIIPPDKGYGANPPPGSGIGVDDTLVFVVDVKKVGS
ncbi:MAG: FKBP-type peptidyl-prolyl cis-trans isomerase [Actinobacteria bacterium]|nr:FKBP-type peptidyl-prolyl cis-trans isomerase [Actinomycetota bacterium]MCB8996064.1 FKBP-type peptidyl-prolyl cis-trans isomerase [Actinomycetota bacterium]MCB9424461.1 FKBP-type peptidyl-prolyl cis-trans isomerase [Actinomycetota bacterium]HRY08387.1 FKBP-type peptidyl-prolyl cis-trans isomerase [Candidatus Nanopelagicales bacterium]